MDVEILSRLQFAFTIAFHYIYPPLSIGLGLMMVSFEGLSLWKGREDYHELARFWTKIFAITFGLGVATGIVMEFEFGTNWAVYSRYVGDVFGSALAAEGVFAFALESGFLGILLFGWNKVSRPVHFIATLGVFLGSMFSAIWIVVANSWMHTPAGFEIVGEGLDARAEITDFWAMVFNPSSVERLLHVWNGAFLAGVLLVISVHSYYLLRGRHEALSRAALRVAVPVGLACALFAPMTGHLAAEIVARYQPAKMAAIEGHWGRGPMDLGIVGWVDESSQQTYHLALPGGASFLLDQDFKTDYPGLLDFPQEERPGQVNAIYQFYHLMVACGLAMIALLAAAFWAQRKGKLSVAGFGESRAMQVLGWALVWAVLLPQIANQTGWFAAEMGRQPYVVYGLLRTSEALSEAVVAEQVLFSLIGFSLVYLVLFGLFVYLMNKKIQLGPKAHPRDPDEMDHRPLTVDLTNVISGDSKT